MLIELSLGCSACYGGEGHAVEEWNRPFTVTVSNEVLDNHVLLLKNMTCRPTRGVLAVGNNDVAIVLGKELDVSRENAIGRERVQKVDCFPNVIGFGPNNASLW